MATSTSTSTLISLLSILLVIFSNADILQARSFPGPVIVQNGVDSMKILRELELEFPKIKHNGRRVMVGIDREVPQGPDPQHH